MNDGPEETALVRALARYLRRNPAACDTAEGIRRWWLDDGDLVAADQLDKALEAMRQRGWIDPTVAADGRIRWRRVASDAQLDALLQQG